MTAPYELPLLTDGHYLGYVGPLAAQGWNKTTHLAEIRYPVQRAPVISVVKLLPSDGLAACNEAIAWLFLRAAGIQCPKQAGLMALSKAKLAKILPRKLPERYLANDMALAWVAQQLNFSSIQALFAGTEQDNRWLRIMTTVQGAALAAFDETFLNCDRNNGNILYLGPNSLAAIDHEAIVGNCPWPVSEIPASNLNSDTLRRLKAGERSGAIGLRDLEMTYNRMVFSAEKHAAALQECQASMRLLIHRLFPSNANEIASRVVSFVATRTARDWMNEWLGTT